MTDLFANRGLEPRTVSMRGECCIDSIAQRHEALLAVLDVSTSVELDLSAVSRIDTAGLQLVAAFVLELRRQGRCVSWSAASPAVLEGARLAGLCALLGLANVLDKPAV